MIVIPCGLEIVVMSMHCCPSQGKNGVPSLFVTVRRMIEGHVQTHCKGACPRSQPKGQDYGCEDPLNESMHCGECYRTRAGGPGSATQGLAGALTVKSAALNRNGAEVVDTQVRFAEGDCPGDGLLYRVNQRTLNLSWKELDS